MSNETATVISPQGKIKSPQGLIKKWKLEQFASQN